MGLRAFAELGQCFAQLSTVITSRGLFQGIAALLLVAAPALAEAPPNRKIDRALQESLREGGATQRVIISVKPGYRADIRQALEKHGDRVKSEHPFVDALAADVHSDDVNELANHPWVLAVSIDATVYAGGAADSYGNINGWQGNVSTGVMPGGAVDTKPANTLRETLGLPRASNSLTPSGSGVGVAIIDSGIAPLDDFAGRITAFYDFTKGGITKNFEGLIFAENEAGYEAAAKRKNEALEAEDAADLGLVTFAPDDIDWDEEIRIATEERSSFSPDALTGLEANYRFAGPETMETKIFGRLTAWQNWIFNRPNASGPDGALRRFGTGQRAVFDRKRV
jgi:hypothetical protein